MDGVNCHKCFVSFFGFGASENGKNAYLMYDELRKDT